MAETPSVPFPVPNPPPPPLKERVVITGAEGGQRANEPINLPPSLALPTDDELRAEQSRQALLQQVPTKPEPTESGGIVSVSRVVVPPAAVTPSPTPAPAAAVPIAPTVPINTGTATDVRPPAEPIPVAAVPVTSDTNPLGQRLIRRPTQPTLAEQISRPAPLTPTPANLFPTTPTAPVAAAPVVAATKPLPPVDANMNMLAGLTDDQPKKKRGPWLAVGIVGILLIISGGVVLWLQSSGTIYSAFLQRMVGGFPKSADQALVLIRQKLPTTYGISGQVSLIKSAALPKIGSEEAAQTTAEISGSMQGTQQNGNWQVSFNWQLASDYPVTTLQGEAIRLDDKHYVFLDTLSLLTTDNSWQEIESADWSKTAIATPFSAVELAAMLGRASAGEYLGQNSLTINDQSYSVATYQYKVDQAAEYQDATYKEGRLLVWVDRKTGQVVEYQLDELLDNAGLGDVVFQSVWVVDSAETVAEVALPKDETAKAGSVSSIAMGLGFIKASTNQDLTTPAGRDAKRLADMLALKEALLEIYQKQGTYPVATAIDKTNSSRVLKGALVPTYIASLPIDPQDPTAYYGYTSDGFSFKLTSIVEQSSSPGAKKGNGFYYQEVTN
jgi:hypothetical protein